MSAPGEAVGRVGVGGREREGGWKEAGRERLVINSLLRIYTCGAGMLTSWPGMDTWGASEAADF